ncbi:MAG: hypothetical protein WBM13_00870 [Bacteroidia bacterium]
MNKNNVITYIFTSLVGLTLTLWIAVIIWASNKGFDITDEGFYLYNYSEINNSKISFTNVHLVQKFLFPFVDCTIQNLRIEKLLQCLLAAASLSFSVVYYIKNSLNNVLPKSKIWFLYLMIVSGFSLTYAFGPQTPAYNFFSSFFITLASSLFIIDLSKKQSKVTITIIYIMIGMLLEFLFLIKFSNAILLVLLLIIVHFAYASIDTQNKLVIIKQTAFRLLIVALSVFITHIVFCGGLSASIAFYKSFFEGINSLKGYDTATLLNTYFDSFTAVFNSLCTAKFLLFAITLATLAWGILKENKRLFYASLLLQLIVIVRFKLYYGGEINKTEQTITYLLWILAFLIVFIVQQKKNSTLKSETFKKQALFLLFLFVLPIAGALGTNNQLQIQIIFYIQFWIVLLYIVIKNSLEPTQSIVLCSFISVFAFIQSANAVVYHPYRINGSLLTQTEVLNISNSETIYVDKRYKETVISIDSILKNANFNTNDYVFYYSDIIGLTHLLKHRLPDASNSWFAPQNIDYNYNILRQLHQEKPTANVFFIVESADTNCKPLINYWTQLRYNSSNYHKSADVNASFSNTTQVLSIYSPE